jgi:hypothetical protein
MPMAIICQRSLKACKGKGLTKVFLIDNNIDSVLGPKSLVLRQVNASRWRLSGFVEHKCGKEWCS